MKITKALCMIPLAFVFWMGKPYRVRHYRGPDVMDLFEHFVIRFLAFGFAIFICSLLLFSFIAIPWLLFIIIGAILTFDGVIWACRAVLVTKIMNEIEEGGNQITVYNQADLWNDDIPEHKSLYDRYYQRR